MNNEEKILEMLTRLTEDVSGLKEDVSGLKEDVSALKETVSRVAIIQENTILPRLDTLAAGHTHLVNTLASNQRVEAIEDEISVIKSVIKSHSDRIAALEKAQ